jgi:hypothetical protein
MKKQIRIFPQALYIYANVLQVHSNGVSGSGRMVGWGISSQILCNIPDFENDFELYISTE